MMLRDADMMDMEADAVSVTAQLTLHSRVREDDVEVRRLRAARG